MNVYINTSLILHWEEEEGEGSIHKYMYVYIHAAVRLRIIQQLIITLPLLSVGVVVSDGVPGLGEQNVVTSPSTRLQQLHHAEPVTQLHAQVNSKVPGSTAEPRQSQEQSSPHSQLPCMYVCMSLYLLSMSR